MERSSTAVWRGGGKDGIGALSTHSGALKDHHYTASSRFVDEQGIPGTNPEELIAAAHASCYAMALAFMLTGEGHAPAELKTTAHVKLEKVNDAWTVTGIRLDVVAHVPGLAPAAFTTLAKTARAECPISRLLSSVPITLEAKLA
jgi:osmotically inducible protein OsmC